MRKFWGILFMLLGISLVAGSLALVMHNRQEDRTAQEFSDTVIPVIQEEIRKIQETAPAVTAPAPTENVPVEFLSPEELIMTEQVINGYAYIGYLAVPDLGLELPVMSGWDSRRLQISPCRYTGTVKGEDIVIMAHNYNAHFGRLSELTQGAQVQFMDMDGQLWNYQVEAIDVLAAEAVEEMTAGEYDLTLFTCAKNRTHRVTVRCNKLAETN